MAFTVTAENAALTGIVGTTGSPTTNRFISLHTADPGLTGTSEVTGGSYARQQTTWANAASSSTTGSAVTIPVPAGTTITHWGLWSALSAGSFIYGGALPASETFGSNGTYSLTPTLTASD